MKWNLVEIMKYLVDIDLMSLIWYFYSFVPLMFSQACYSHAITYVPLYDTLGIYSP